jgi:hypothetical protein
MKDTGHKLFAFHGYVDMIWYSILHGHYFLQMKSGRDESYVRCKKENLQAYIGDIYELISLACHLNGLAYILGVIWVFKWVGSHKHDIKSHTTGPYICKLH